MIVKTGPLHRQELYVIREGDPVGEMVFVMRGKLLNPQSWSHFPISTRTVQALTEVEAFSLAAEDLKSAASQFRRLHNKQLQHTFQVLFLILSLSLLKVNYNLFLCNVVRLYSVQWRTWGASFVQAAWRRHCRRKLTKSLQEEKDRLRDALERANEIQQPRVRHRR
uniref:Cyclic nucleotide-binding domain-containing protein n=1 Tax=Brassica campestris TaxID=3711 RepID=M4FI58_BRACM